MKPNRRFRIIIIYDDYYYIIVNKMLLFTMYVKDEYTAKKMELSTKKLSTKLKTKTEMKWQWVKDGKKLVVACDFYKDDEET